MAVDIEACWNSAETVCGLNTDPWNSATYTPTATSQAAAIACHGAEKKLPQACSTLLFVNATSRPPSTVAVNRASTVTVSVFPSSTDSLRISPNGRRCLSLVPSSEAGGGGVAAGSVAG